MSSFLYPSLVERPIARGDREFELLDELSATVAAVWNEAEVLVDESLVANTAALASASELILRQVAAGGRLLVCGNGGSACDAERLVRILRGRIPSRSLLDPIICTALGNDVGVQRMFSRQVETCGKSVDIIAVFTTSGTSANVVEAIVAGKRIGASTIAFAGYNGGDLRIHPDVDVCLSVDSTSVHRIQEVQAALCDELADRLIKGVSP